jgi:ABC-type cobalamin transport system permease subunit
MQDVAMRRRIAVLVIAALLAISGAALATAVLATDQTLAVYGGIGGDDVRAAQHTGNDLALGGKDTLKGLESGDY